MDALHLTKLYVRDFMGLADAEVNLDGAITLVSGANGEGKTTILSALKSIFEGGCDVTEIRAGADKAEVLVGLSDGSSVRKVLYRDSARSVLEVRDGEGRKLPAPRSVVSEMAAAVEVNPVAWLLADKGERLRILLENLPVRITSEVLAAAGIDANTLRGLAGGSALADPGLHGPELLSAIDTIYDAVFARRRECNTGAKAARATVSQLEAAMPAAPEQDIAQQITEKREAIEALAGEVREIEEREQAAAQSAVKDEQKKFADQLQQMQSRESAWQQMVDTHNEEIRSLTLAIEDHRRKIDALKAEIKASDRDRAAVAEQIMVAFSQHGNASRARIAEQTQAIEQRRTALAGEIKLLEQQQREQIRAEEIRQMADRTRANVESLEREATSQTAALAKLQRLRQAAVAAAGFAGLEIRDGEIYVDGVHVDKLNTASQIALALRIRKLRPSKLPLCVVDGIERLDRETRKKFFAAAVKSGLQFVVTEVTDGPLTVTPASA